MTNILYFGPSDHYAEIVHRFPRSNICHVQNEQQLLARCHSVDIILDAYMGFTLNSHILSKMPNLKLISCASTGFTHLDIDYLESNNILFHSLADQRDFLLNITPAAEHSWLLLMMCARKVRSALNDVSNLIWDRNNHPGILLKGKTLGIIGAGRIGTWMSTYAKAFGMNTLAFDPYLKSFNHSNFTLVDKHTLLRNSDFVSLHVKYSSDTGIIFGKDDFALMKHNSSFINTSRGELVDEVALLNSLSSGHLSAAAVDVLSGEPDVASNQLLIASQTLHNLIITPHIGGYCPEVLSIVIAHCCDRISKSLPSYV